MPAPAASAPREGRQCPECGQRFTSDGAFCPFDGTKLEVATFVPLSDALLGTTVDGRYEVEALLGEGGMGQVYRVRHVALDRPFAMKVLKRELARDVELGARFIDEARATAAIHHPNVVQITDFGRLPSDAPYFVMELLVGRTLGQLVKSGGPVPPGRAAAVLRQVASAVGAAHAAGIVHRDLKPDNVFLVEGPAAGSPEGEVRVVDFGAAKIIGSSRVTRQGVVFGTPHYMSPEQASGQPVDHRADIYALGVIMYEMFTGRVPFEADTYMGVLTQHMFVQPVAPSVAYPPAAALGALEEVTLTCLAKKPEERFTSMQELSDAIAMVVNPRDGSIAPRGSLPPRPGTAPRAQVAGGSQLPMLEEMRAGAESLAPPMKKPPWVWLAVGAAAVALVGVVWAVSARTGARAATESGTPPGSATGSATASESATVTATEPVTATPAALPPAPMPVAATAPAPPPVASVATPPRPVPASRPRPQPPRGLDEVADPFAARR